MRPLVILLHGFPDFSYGWKHQIPYLASAGYRVWAPDLRGYNLSDKPDGLASYRLDVLAADVVGLIEAAGQKQVFLVGHDVGRFHRLVGGQQTSRPIVENGDLEYPEWVPRKYVYEVISRNY